MNHRHRIMPLVTSVVLAVFTNFAFALDTPTISLGTSGHGKQTITVTAGPSGAPDGFTIWWMDAQEFAANGGQWPSSVVEGQGVACFTGIPTLNTFGESQTTFQLATNQSIIVEIGDLSDETGVAGTVNELEYGQTYHFVAFANAANNQPGSSFSSTVTGSTTTNTNCTYTQGYWKNHPTLWPVTSLMLGSVNYTSAELLSILNQPVSGNGLISLAHQLIAAKLNIANGADPTAASATIAAADAQIGSLVVPPVGAGFLDPSSTSEKTQILDDYNNGIIGPGHCGDVPVESESWSTVKALYIR